MNVAEVTLALTGACAKNLVELARQMRQGQKLNKRVKSLYSATLLTGKTFGIIGGGTIGQLVARKL
jgi:D-3-phosphoglycerate dehydrogenase